MPSLYWSQGSPTVLSPYPRLKAVQPYRVLIRGSRQSNRAKSLSRAQGSPTVPSSQLFRNHSKRVHTSGSIVLGNLPRLLPSSQYTLANTDGLLVSDLHHLVSTPWLISMNMKMYLCYLASAPWPLPMNIKMDLCHLASTPWLILMTRLTTSSRKRSSCIQPTAHSSALDDARGW